jgi:pimeloyl-ACP methyl ester carboxylesterase
MTQHSRMNTQPTEHRVSVNGVELAYFEWGERSGSTQATVLLAHATGFHARCWDRTVALLARDTHVISLDQRGHGRSAKTGPFNWLTFGTDLTEFVKALDLVGICGVGHSMGGHAMTQAAAAEPDRFERLVLVDPVITDPDLYADWGEFGAMRLADHPTSRRKNQWRDWQEMFDRFADRAPFSSWRREILEDYCRYGVLQNPDGPGYVLACPPLVEAAIYTGSAGRDIFQLIRGIQVPVTILRAPGGSGKDDGTMDFSASPTWERLAEEFQHGRDVYLPHLTHFIPMQEPERVAEWITGS